MDVDRNAASVVVDGDGIVGVEGDQDAAGMARQRLVNRVVDDLVDHVMQAGPVIGVYPKLLTDVFNAGIMPIIARFG